MKTIVKNPYTSFMVLSATIVALLAIYNKINIDKKRRFEVDNVNNWNKVKKLLINRNTSKKDIIVAQFVDYGCPFCKELPEVIKSSIKGYENKVILKYINYPLDIHKLSRMAARYSECAKKKGHVKKYHREILSLDSLSNESFRKISNRIGIDNKYMEECAKGEWAKNQVHNDIRLSKKLKVESTPTIFVNEHIIRGVPSKNYLTKIINDEAIK